MVKTLLAFIFLFAICTVLFSNVGDAAVSSAIAITYSIFDQQAAKFPDQAETFNQMKMQVGTLILSLKYLWTIVLYLGCASAVAAAWAFISLIRNK